MTTKPQSDADVARAISRLIPDAHQLDYDEDDITALIAQHVAARLAETAKEWGVTLDKDGNPLSVDVCHTLLQRLQRDEVARTKPLVEALEDIRERAFNFSHGDTLAELSVHGLANIAEKALAQEKTNNETS